MEKWVWIVIVILVLLVLGVGGYFLYKHEKKEEGYTAGTGWDLSIDGQYEMINSPESEVPTPYFADLVAAEADNKLSQASTLGNIRPLERLDRDADSHLMPRTSKSVTPYNIDVADPKTYMFQVNMPRVVLKDPQWEQADPYRGDIPIKFYPNVPLVGKSQYGSRSSWRGDGYFSEFGKELYAKYTGQGYLNKPIIVANQETIGDFIPQEYIN
jgi:hypothetical protein